MRLFEPLTIGAVTLRNRIAMSPMCMYSCDDGFPTDWHRVHLGARAVGGVGLVITEATAIEPCGRISPMDAGIWSDQHAERWSLIAASLKKLGAVPGMQIAHAGRKASTRPPSEGRGAVPEKEGGWLPVAPSPVPFKSGDRPPHPLDPVEIRELVQRWARAAQRVRDAGFEVLEVHMAHGYLLHQFLSPLTNQRQDDYGGNRENRFRFPLEVAEAVRDAWPNELPLFVRISASDWAEGGWDLEDAIVFCTELKRRGVDLIDCSSGGAVSEQKIPSAPGFQVPFAERIRREAGLATGAVGMITDPQQAEQILQEDKADLILLGRELLRDPHWPQRAARTLGHPSFWPKQYAWAID
jgi:2,4-dienoyl-CoA reductase-like NADH-dependent reductase (Old Yellow Enzyme family)